MKREPRGRTVVARNVNRDRSSSPALVKRKRTDAVLALIPLLLTAEGLLRSSRAREKEKEELLCLFSMDLRSSVCPSIAAWFN